MSKPFKSDPAHSTRPHSAKKMLAQAHFCWASQISYFPVSTSAAGIFGPNTQQTPTSNPKLTNNWGPTTSTFHAERPLQRHGRFKLKFLCEWFSPFIYSSCSIEFNKSWYTWSLTPVKYYRPILYKVESNLNCCGAARWKRRELIKGWSARFRLPRHQQTICTRLPAKQEHWKLCNYCNFR